MFQSVTAVLPLLIVTLVPLAAVGAFCIITNAELLAVLWALRGVWPVPAPPVPNLLALLLLAAAKTHELLRVVVSVALAVLLLALLLVADAPKALEPSLFDKSNPVIPNVISVPAPDAVNEAVTTLALTGVGATQYQTSQSPPCVAMALYFVNVKPVPDTDETLILLPVSGSTQAISSSFG